MKVTSTKLVGVLVIEPQVFSDERGFFIESYNNLKYEQAGIKEKFVQDNLSKSKKGVLRGLHFQRSPHAQGKLVQVIKGRVMDVVVDIRYGSPTYGEHISVELSEENKKQIWIPAGFAHGFIALEDDTIFYYKCTDFYNKEFEG
ncbi:MAG: dTDP-4-dehydrorhamnose 3,5-epimerase, partial [Candidatus Falkowbacteria bacterium]|nr:dTDP-4-dehydrorhamnose 3,5-epimerase [Candidatus Falkowbacteria bacterium]